jgi:putative ABC transport system ATP-binding protein
MSDDPLLKIKNLSKGYQEGDTHHSIFSDINCTVAGGELVVLIGRSGSGKSTLLNLISGIDLPDTGSVTIAGNDFTLMSEYERTLFRRRHIGFIFQFFNLIPTLSVKENILLPLQLTGRKNLTESAFERLKSVGLYDRLDCFPELLSGGEQQRVAIARALAHSPLLILADEPTGNLDKKNGDTVLDILIEQVRSGGHTLIMATHSFDIANRADRILDMEGGQLREQAKQVNSKPQR